MALGGRIKARYLRMMAGVASAVTLVLAPAGVIRAGSAGSSGTLNGTLYFTRFCSPPGGGFSPGCGSSTPDNVGDVTFSYNGTTLSIGSPQGVAQVPAADGIAFTPARDLLIGGQLTGDVFNVDPATGTFTSTPAGTPTAYMIGLSADGQTAYVGSVGDNSGGQIGEVGLSASACGGATPPCTEGTITVSGPDQNVDAIAFADGVAYYTSSLPAAPGDFGTIDLSTGQETQISTNDPWAHGMVYDPYTGDLIASGEDEVAQINPLTGQVVGTQTFALDSSYSDGNAYYAVFDLPWVDGQGHAFIAANNGQLAFIDYRASGNIGSATTVQTVYVSSWLDDIVGTLSNPPACVVALAPTGPHTIWGGSSGQFDVNCNVMDDSVGNCPAPGPSSTGTCYADTVDDFGNSSTAISGQLDSVAPVALDPCFAPAGATSAVCPSHTSGTISYAGGMVGSLPYEPDPFGARPLPQTADTACPGGTPQVFTSGSGNAYVPGVYEYPVYVTGSATFAACGSSPGIYIFNDGLFVCPGAGQAVTGSDVLLYSAAGQSGPAGPGGVGGAGGAGGAGGLPGSGGAGGVGGAGGAGGLPGSGGAGGVGGAGGAGGLPGSGGPGGAGGASSPCGSLAATAQGGPANGADGIYLGGQGSITLSGATSGQWAGMLLFQDRSVPADMGLDNHEGDSATITLTGGVSDDSLANGQGGVLYSGGGGGTVTINGVVAVSQFATAGTAVVTINQ